MNKYIVGTVKGKKTTALFEPNSPKGETLTTAKNKFSRKTAAKSNLNVFVDNPSLNDFPLAKHESS